MKGAIPMAIDQITESDLRAFGEKLDKFGNDLSAKEQVLLGEILLRAASAGDDVEGHRMALPHVTKPTWPEIRKNMHTILSQALEELGKSAQYGSYGTPGMPF